MKHIVLNVETTGLSIEAGDRVIAIAGIEFIDGLASGKSYLQYIKTSQTVSENAFKAHSLKNSFLKDKPRFSDIKNDFLEFIKDATIIVHNANYNMPFLNNEFAELGGEGLENDVIDTVSLARKQFPKGSVHLTALKGRLEVEPVLEKDVVLAKVKLLAEIYLKLVAN